MRSRDNAQKPQIWPISLCQNSAKKEKNQQIMTIIEAILAIIMTHQYEKLQAIPYMYSPGNA